MARTKGSKNKKTGLVKTVVKKLKAQAKPKDDIFNYELCGFAKPNDKSYKYWHTQVLLGIKNIPSKVVDTPVKDYLKGYNEQVNQVRASTLKVAVEQGRKLAIPYHDKYTGKKGDLDIARCAELCGMDTIPVLVIG